MPRGENSLRTTSTRLKVALRRIEAMKMRIDGIPVPEIMAALGYRSTAAVYQDIGRALAHLGSAPAADLRAIEVARMDAELVRLNELEVKVREVRDREHITVNNGRVIYVPGDTLPDGSPGPDVPLLDDDPVLRATAQLLGIEDRRANIQTRRAKLLGLNAPDKVSVITDEALDDALATEAAELAELERAAAGEDRDVEDGEGEEG